MKIYTLPNLEDTGFTKSEESLYDCFVKMRTEQYKCGDDSRAFRRVDEELYDSGEFAHMMALLAQAGQLKGRKAQHAKEMAIDYIEGKIDELATKWAVQDANEGEWKE